MKISSFLKLAGGIFLMLLLLLGINLYTMNQSFEELKASNQRQVEFLNLGQQLTDASDYLTDQIKSYVETGDKSYYDAYWKEVNETKSREDAVNKLTELGALDEELALIEEAQANSNTLISTEEKALEAVESGNFELARELIFGSSYNSAKSKIEEPVEKFKSNLNERASAEVLSAENDVSLSIVFMIALIAVLAALVLGVFVFIAKKVGSLNEVGKILKELESSGGDLTARVAFSGKDEIGSISQSFNKVLESLQLMLISIKEEAEHVLDASSSMSNEMNSLDISIEEISATTEEISAGMEETAAASEEMNATSEEIESAVEAIATKAQEILEFINSQVVSDYDMLVETGNKYSGDAEMVETLVNELSATSEELLASIHTMIRSIGEVTNATNDSATGITDIATGSTEMLNMSKDMVSQIDISRKSIENLFARIDNFKLS